MSLFASLLLASAQVINPPSLNSGQAGAKWRNLMPIESAQVSESGILVFTSPSDFDAFMRRATQGLSGGAPGVDWMREQIIAVIPPNEPGSSRVLISSVQRIGLTRTLVRAQINASGRRRDRSSGRPIGLAAVERGLTGFEVQFTRGLDRNHNNHGNRYGGYYDPYGYPNYPAGGVWGGGGSYSVGGSWQNSPNMSDDGSVFPQRPLNSGSYVPQRVQAREPKVTILKSRQDLVAWLGADAARSLPGDDQVRWGDEQIVVVSLGQRNSGGYSVTVDRVRYLTTDRVVVEATERTPEPGMMTTQALTYPYAMVITPRRNADYRLIIKRLP